MDRKYFAVGVAIAIIVALGGWAIWDGLGKSGVPSPSSAPSASLDDSAEDTSDVVARAMRDVPPEAAPVDSVKFKMRWLDDVRGVDLAGLDEPKRELFLRFANAERCSCGCGYTLATCKASDMTCEVSGAMLATLLDSIRAGQIRSAKGVRARPKPGSS